MVENPNIYIERKMLEMVDVSLGAIELTAQRMAKSMLDSRRGRKKPVKLSEEEQLLQVPEYFEIAQTIIVAKFSIGLITDEERNDSLKKMRDSRDAVKKKLGLKDSSGHSSARKL